MKVAHESWVFLAPLYETVFSVLLSMRVPLAAGRDVDTRYQVEGAFHCREAGVCRSKQNANRGRYDSSRVLCFEEIGPD